MVEQAPSTSRRRVAVLTSGGDAQGMNPAVRGVVRTGLNRGAEMFAVYEGYQGLVDGGEAIRHVEWDDVSGVLNRGGTVIGTARSKDFRERDGRRTAVKHLLEHGIDRLVVIGGDGSLSGADLLRSEWASLVQELADRGEIDQDTADRHPALMIAGLVGSIDNDMLGTDMTIGADSALHRIVEAIDSIGSTAASHQRSFVVEVMGRHCGYLALMGAIAGGADYVLIPEDPPLPGWEQKMCALLASGREAGRRNSIVIVAEGAHDRDNNPITSEYVLNVIRDTLNEDVRLTILGHVQRGGDPSAYDRYTSSILGYAALEEVLSAKPDGVSKLIGTRGNRVSKVPLMESVAQTRALADAIAAKDFNTAMAMRGNEFTEMEHIFHAISHALPTVTRKRKSTRLGILNVGGLAPGMNAVARAAVRLGLDRGHTMVGISNSFQGLVDDEVRELQWGDVEGWTSRGGAELGISRRVPTVKDLYAIGRGIEKHGLDGLLIVGGWDAFAAVSTMRAEQDRYPAFQVPMIVLPATIDNNMPASEQSVGADTALNLIVDSIDRIRQTGTASKRVFVVETMGGYCGYLALMGGLSGGAVKVYLHEEGITLKDIAADVENMVDAFRAGQRLFLTVRNEKASPMYTSDFLVRVFEQESQDLYDAREIVLGQTQQGGSPTPIDRILGTRLAAHSIDWLSHQVDLHKHDAAMIGMQEGTPRIRTLRRVEEMADWEHRRPVRQWWMELRPVIDVLAARLALPENA
ncbi:6-phosphofructokinase [Nakamurella flava]|uniref:6-phosphofructokinase n=1 Tax=Nakamurella flava TaxID=2576308 RepID=A0A4U6Q8Z6_9ACTN|nr:6-phosphofructokinase [Nakamurella flava]TKV56338.1 6-phosphofructokinase [Nakamurella flava]